MSGGISSRLTWNGILVDLTRSNNLSELRGPDKRALDLDLHIHIGKRTWAVNRCAVRVHLKLIDAMLKRSVVFVARPQEITLDVRYVKPATFDQVLDLIYEGRVRVWKRNVLYIHAASTYLRYAELGHACVSVLRLHLDLSQFTVLFRYANLVFKGPSDLLEICQNKMVENFEQWSKMDEFCLLSYEELSNVMDTAGLRSGEMDENVVFEGLVRWLYFDWADRCVHVNDILAKVQWKRVNAGRAIEFELVGKICGAKTRSLKEQDARNVLFLQVIGLGPARDVEGLLGVKGSENRKNETCIIVIEHSEPVTNYQQICLAGVMKNNRTFLATFDRTFSSWGISEQSKLFPTTIYGVEVQLCDVCTFDSCMYILACTHSNYVLYARNYGSEDFLSTFLQSPFGQTFGASDTRLFTNGTTFFILGQRFYRRGPRMFYINRDRLEFSLNLNPLIAKYSPCLNHIDPPVPYYAHLLRSTTFVFDSGAGRLYFCGGQLSTYDACNLVFYMDLVSKEFGRCPDLPVKLTNVAATVHEGSLLIAGGEPGLGLAPKRSSRVWRLRQNDSDWLELQPMNRGHAKGTLLVRDDHLIHFDIVGDENSVGGYCSGQVHYSELDPQSAIGLEILDLKYPSAGWILQKNSMELSDQVLKLQAFFA